LRWSPTSTRERDPMTTVLAIALAVVLADEKPKANQWEPTIAAFEKQDQAAPPAPGGIVFVGSSSIRLWNVKHPLPHLPCTNRVFGGSQMAASVRYADRIVIPYKPKIVVVFAGGNDITAGKTPETVTADFESLTKKIHAALPETKIYFVSLFPNPRRWQH